jgi:hypothetical protein
MQAHPTIKIEEMKSSVKTRSGILITLLLVSAGAIYAYREFNREKESVEAMEAMFKVKAADLIRDFTSDEGSATGKYAGKVMEVDGILKETIVTAPGQMTIVMGDGVSSTSVRFSIDSSFVIDPIGLTPKMGIRMKGVCTGYMPDELGIGADIIFNRGIISDPNNNR